MYDFFVKFAGTFLGWLAAEFIWDRYERRKKDARYSSSRGGSGHQDQNEKGNWIKK